MKWTKKGLIYCHTQPNNWWNTHTMAPSAIKISESVIRVFVRCWDKNGISRIGYVDVEANNPSNILKVSDKPVLDLGEDGCFDENGVFPAHAYVHDGKVYLYYTGFQLGHKIRHYNFGGLAIADLGSDDFQRVSKAPVLDRQDEGLFVRAGQSILFENGIFKTVYSAGSGWEMVGGKPRPQYDVRYQESIDGTTYQKTGKVIATSNPNIEHGLGRPQLTKIGTEYYVFYTRRMKDMKYYLGYSTSPDGKTWTKIDTVDGLYHGKDGWDSEMVYFPSAVVHGNRVYLFYCGNNFGEAGFGYAEAQL